MKLVKLEETTSTNDEVKRAIKAGHSEGLVVRAVRQNGGYGRQGRPWDSPAGGLYMSLLLRPGPGDDLSTLSLAVGLAVRSALAKMASPSCKEDIQLKWPNDVVYFPEECARADEYRKLCGISTEAFGGGVCVGIGVNVFPPEIARPVSGRNVPVYLADLIEAPASGINGSVTVGQAVAALPEPLRAQRIEEVITDVQREVLARLFVSYRRWSEMGFSALRNGYENVSFLRGRPVRIENARGETTAEGIVRGVDDHGRLELDVSGEVLPVSSGEAHVIVMP